MISEEEVKSIALRDGIPLPYVEKDYVMGWLLWGIYNDPQLKHNLVLKGGNCLRKVYFQDTRFSDDLDFSTKQRLDLSNFKANIEDVCKKVSEKSGINFDLSRTKVEIKPTPDPSCFSIDARVYFAGFGGDSKITMKIKFDVSEYEKIVLPTQTYELIHNYSDSNECKVNVICYSLEEVLAEKLRSWIQRTRPKDLFDVVAIVNSGSIPINQLLIMNAFLQKTLYKGIAVNGKNELLFEEKFAIINDSWEGTIICPSKSIIKVAMAISFFKDFINNLFDKRIVDSSPFNKRTYRVILYNPNSGIRESIICAGKERKMIRMRYHGIDRDIEPYSFRYKVVDGTAIEYFYGFDRTRGNHIKCFRLHEIQSVSIKTQRFIPRWPVEF